MTYLTNNTANEDSQTDIKISNFCKSNLPQALRDQPENLSSRKLWSLLTESILAPQDAERVKQELTKRKHLSLFDRSPSH